VPMEMLSPWAGSWKQGLWWQHTHRELLYGETPKCDSDGLVRAELYSSPPVVEKDRPPYHAAVDQSELVL
jgi:hypothetical protein